MTKHAAVSRGREDGVAGRDRRAARYWRLRTAFEIVKFTAWATAFSLWWLARVVREFVSHL
ncbi:hypothetical protein ACWEN6_39530 [Sphaerisporangium sp. NPDC004334]